MQCALARLDNEVAERCESDELTWGEKLIECVEAVVYTPDVSRVVRERLTRGIIR